MLPPVQSFGRRTAPVEQMIPEPEPDQRPDAVNIGTVQVSVVPVLDRGELEALAGHIGAIVRDAVRDGLMAAVEEIQAGGPEVDRDHPKEARPYGV